MKIALTGDSILQRRLNSLPGDDAANLLSALETLLGSDPPQ